MNFKAEKIISPANTQRMNSQLISYLIISIFIFSCSENEIQIISNTLSDLPDKNYKINLWSSNSGSTLETVTINWNGSDEEVELYDSGELINPSGNSHTFSGMNPGEFRDITIQVITDDSTYVDSIQIFTRPVYPVTLVNQNYEIVYDTTWDYQTNWDFTFDSLGVKMDSTSTIDTTYETFEKYHRTLLWSPTLESNFDGYNIYRDSVDGIINLIHPIESNKIKQFTNKLDTTYTDLQKRDVPGEFTYYYSVQVYITSGFQRNSYIFNNPDLNPTIATISLATSNVSKNNNEFIQITWEPVSNSTYFYQYEIWRISDDNADDLQIMAIIIDPAQGKFMDRNVGNGTSYNYSVTVVDINENRVFSDYVTGWSTP